MDTSNYDGQGKSYEQEVHGGMVVVGIVLASAALWTAGAIAAVALWG